jgi:hypothetical protein
VIIFIGSITCFQSSCMKLIFGKPESKEAGKHS